MSNLLPKAPLAASRTDPKIAVFYGVPKVGKTTKMAELPGNLILDLEKGAELVESLRVPIGSIDGPTIPNADGTIKSTSINAVIAEIEAMGMEEYKRTGKLPEPPYRYITVDTMDKLEDYAEVVATRKYKASVIGSKFEGNSVIELPNGAGYYHLRNEILLQIERLSMICRHLILISHTRDKVLDKGGIEVTSTELSLTGKLGKIICAKADLIGYVYREPKKPLMVNFQTFEGSTMGTRVPRLAGKNIEFDWKQIFSQDPNLVTSDAA